MAPRLHRLRRRADPLPDAAEALLRRLTKHGDIPSVSLLVDAGNLVSIRYGLPVAVLDLAGVAGTITVRFARGSEEFMDLGATAVEHPEPGEVIFADEANVVHARRWCWRQSALSATRPATREILIAVEGHHETAVEEVEAALDDLGSLLSEHASADALERAVLTSTTLFSRPADGKLRSCTRFGLGVFCPLGSVRAAGGSARITMG